MVIIGVVLETDKIWRVTIGQGADGEGRIRPVAGRRFERIKHIFNHQGECWRK